MVYPDFEPTAFSFPLLHLLTLKDGIPQEMHLFNEPLCRRLSSNFIINLYILSQIPAPS